MVVYTFENDDEGFGAITGNGSKQYTFDNWINPEKGESDIYRWELIGVLGYSLHQSINSYTTMTIPSNSSNVLNTKRTINRRLLKELVLTDPVYSAKRSRLEII